MTSFTTDVTTFAPVEDVWQVLGDIGRIADWNPGIQESYKTSEDNSGLGATRFCDLGGKNYLNEEVVQWEDCRKLTMRIVDSNLPFKRADIHFTLQSENGHTQVAVSPDYELKYGPFGNLMDRIYVRQTYEKGMKNRLLGLKEHVEKGGEATQ